MERVCRITGRLFEITDKDAAFYTKIGVPLPTLCPEERQCRRLVWRNERFLYHGVCFLCKKNIISSYPPEVKFPVLCPDCFWSDRFDPLNYGRDFDFNRSFFEQLGELFNAVPQMSVMRANCVNSDYTLNCINNKNCYMTSGADFNEDCMYGFNTQRSKDCLDHILIYDSQLCYGCLYSARLYNCVGCQDSENCNDSWFLFDCKSCSNCAFSSNLRNKKYVFENQQFSKEEYEKKLSKKLKKIFENPLWLYENLQTVRGNAIQRFSTVMNGENVTGNYIRNSKDSFDVFDAEDCQDCRYCYYALDMKDATDGSCIGWGELVYEFVSDGKLKSVFFSNGVIESHDVMYSRSIYNCSDIFASASLKNHQQYVIFNKKYSKQEYEELVPRIVEHMGGFRASAQRERETERKSGFASLSEVELYKRETDQKTREVNPEIPVCLECRKNFLIIPQEEIFYKKKNIPPPQICWPCRAKHLIMQRRPYKLFDSSCTNCGAPIRTAAIATEKEKIYCERCYLETVY